MKRGCIFQRGAIWYVSYYDRAGRQHQESTRSKKRVDAERRLTSCLHDLDEGRPTVKANLTFEETRDHYLTHQANNLRAGHAAVDARRQRQHTKTTQRIAKWLTPFFGGRKVAAITNPLVERYKRERLEQKASPATVNRELQLLKRIFSLAIQSGLLRDRPYIEMLRESPPRSGFFEDEQIAAVLRHLPDAIQPVVEFMWRTGWRVTEVLTLEWRQVDFTANEVRLDPGTTKNGKGRVIKMSTEVRTLLEARQRAADALKDTGVIVPWVFWRMVPKGKRSRTGVRGGRNAYRGEAPKPITTFGKAWKAACKAAGCPGRIPHDLRRTAVRNYIRAGVPQVVAMQYTGHETDSIFRRYNIVSEDDLVDAARRMSGRHVVSR